MINSNDDLHLETTIYSRPEPLIVIRPPLRRRPAQLATPTQVPGDSYDLPEVDPSPGHATPEEITRGPGHHPRYHMTPPKVPYYTRH